MASENKKKKLKNSFCVPLVLKNKQDKVKTLLFYTSSQRKFLDEEMKKEFLQFLKDTDIEE